MPVHETGGGMGMVRRENMHQFVDDDSPDRPDHTLPYSGCGHPVEVQSVDNLRIKKINTALLPFPMGCRSHHMLAEPPSRRFRRKKDYVQSERVVDGLLVVENVSSHLPPNPYTQLSKDSFDL
jgi:hypothetical protein